MFFFCKQENHDFATILRGFGQIQRGWLDHSTTENTAPLLFLIEENGGPSPQRTIVHGKMMIIVTH
jgi:hypothetical protein